MSGTVLLWPTISAGVGPPRTRATSAGDVVVEPPDHSLELVLAAIAHAIDDPGGAAHPVGARGQRAFAIFSSPSSMRARGQPKLKRIQPGQPK